MLRLLRGRVAALAVEVGLLGAVGIGRRLAAVGIAGVGTVRGGRTPGGVPVGVLLLALLEVLLLLRVLLLLLGVPLLRVLLLLGVLLLLRILRVLLLLGVLLLVLGVLLLRGYCCWGAC